MVQPALLRLLGNDKAVNSETAKVGGWRCSSTLSHNEQGHHIILELDRNLGGMWPRVVLMLTARSAESTSISVIASSPSEDQTVTGPSGTTYTEGIVDSCIPAILKGAATGLGARRGIDVAVTSGGYAIDTAEAICERAAEIALRVLTQDPSHEVDLNTLLEQCVANW